MKIHSFSLKKASPSAKIDIELNISNSTISPGTSVIQFELRDLPIKFFKKSSKISYFITKDEISFLNFTPEQKEYFKLTTGRVFSIDAVSKIVNLGYYPHITLNELKALASFLEIGGIRNSYVYKSKILSEEVPKSIVTSGEYTILDFPGHKAPLAIPTKELIINPKKYTTCGDFKLNKTNINHSGSEIVFSALRQKPKASSSNIMAYDGNASEETPQNVETPKKDEFNNPNLNRFKELLKLLLSKFDELEALEKRIQDQFLAEEEELYTSLINSVKLV